MKNFLSIVLLIALVFPLHAQLKCISGNCSNGYGTCVFSNGAKYVGDFKNGKLHGKGIFYYTDGNQYIGNWVNQLREGKGRMIFSNGDEYFGIFRSNKMEGNGKMTYANGNVYEGMWQSDRPSGQGVLLFADGARYDGEFGNGVFDGYGVFRYIDQSRYEGNWRNGKQHGIGTLYTYDNQSVSGNWISGVFESDQLQWKSLETIDTSSLRNCNLNFCAEGKGKYRYADGTLFIGDFNNGRPAGEGTILFLDGKRYKGQWTAGQPNGRGVMYYKDGRVVGALWQNGNAVQQLFVESGHPLGTPVSVDYNEEVKIWAVVVGAASYTYMPSLRYTDDDAYQVYAFLKSPEGGALPDHQIQVLIDENATREGILEAMRTTFLKADNNDVLLFYFSGHGLKGAFLPIDYDGQDNQLYHEQIKEILQLSKAKHKLILADACHSGSLLSLKAPLNTVLKKYYKAFDDAKGGTALLMSSKGEEYSLEDGGLRSGIFSHFLVKGLKGAADFDKDSVIYINELFRYVQSNVKEYTGNIQNPTLTGDFDNKTPVAVVRGSE